MSFLKTIYNCSTLEANKKVQSIAKDMDINLSIGDNSVWLNEDEFEHLYEEGILVNENLVTLLEKQGVEFSDILREDFLFMREGEEREIYLKDDSGLYSANIFLDYLEINGVQNFEVWLDFNHMYRESNECRDLDDMPSNGVIRY